MSLKKLILHQLKQKRSTDSPEKENENTNELPAQDDEGIVQEDVAEETDSALSEAKEDEDEKLVAEPAPAPDFDISRASTTANDARLSVLRIDEGTLTPAFDSNMFDYTAMIPSDERFPNIIFDAIEDDARFRSTLNGVSLGVSSVFSNFPGS